jgi:hypothetical protein
MSLGFVSYCNGEGFYTCVCIDEYTHIWSGTVWWGRIVDVSNTEIYKGFL